MLVVWSPLALRQIARIFDYLDELNPRAAAEVSAHLVEAGDSLADFPYRGRPLPNTGLRELVTAYPYIIRYSILEARCEFCASATQRGGRQVHSRAATFNYRLER